MMIRDVREFMFLTDQLPMMAEHSADLVKLYQTLIEEEYQELHEATCPEERLDACLDLIWVLIGYAIAHGWNVREAWKEVRRTNMAKIQFDASGAIIRREDGKILKPENWKGPELTPFVKCESQQGG